MNAMIAAVFLASMAIANAGLLAVSGGNIIQGPSSRSTLVGPDGSLIASAVPGGQVINDVAPGLVGTALDGSAILQGPSTRTTLVGPDGNIISSLAPGGKLVSASVPGVVAQPIPVAVSVPAVSVFTV